jgi:outer membrane protein assembly factor BamD
MPFSTFRFAVLALAVSGAVACHRGRVAPELAPDTQFALAMRSFRAGRWADARTRFQRLNFDLAARDVLLPAVRYYSAECLFGRGELLTAARDLRRVADDYPADSLAPVALLRAGDAYEQLWRHVQLDATNGQTALATWQELAGRYPDTRAAQLAALRIHDLQDRFARKDFESGIFYFKRGGFDSAILYFRGLIAQYPGASVVPEAFVKLVESYRAIGYHEELNETCAHLRQYFGARADVRRVCGDRNPGR